MRSIILFIALSLNGLAQYNYMQMMHNSADTSVKHLKLWLNGSVWLQQFDYLMSTPQTSLGAAIHTIGVSAPGATSQAQCIAQTTLDNTNTNYSFAFLAVVGINHPGPQYNPGSTLKPFGIYTYTFTPIMGEPSPWQCFPFVSHLSTDIASLTVVSSSTIFANALDYKNTTNQLLTVTQAPNGIGLYTVSVSSPSGSIGTGTLTLQGGKKICIVSTGFTDTLANAKMAGGGKRFALAAVPPLGGMAVEIPVKIPGTVTGLGEPENTNGVPHFYPSPAKDYLYIELEGREQANVVLYDLFGKILLSKTVELPKANLDLKDLSAGIYLIKVSDGTTIYNSKILVE